TPLLPMRRRTIQYLVVLAVVVVCAHFYFSPDPLSLPHTPDWLDLDYRPGYAGADAGKDVLGVALPPVQGVGEDSGNIRVGAGKTSGIKEVGAGAGAVPAGSGHGMGADIEKRESVVGAFKYAWSAYERDAMGFDEYHPISRRGSNLAGANGIGYTVVDALDTMLLMGLEDEYGRARAWVEKSLDFSKGGYVSTFETTIRVLGGLLSAYHLSGDSLYLRHASDLGTRLSKGAFGGSPSGMPYPQVNLGPSAGLGAGISVSEVSTLQLEFRYLAHLTDDEDMWWKAENVMLLLNRGRLENGLAPYALDMATGEYAMSGIRMGSNADSYYEYLLKQYLQTNQTEPVYLQMYEDSMQGINDHLLKRTPGGVSYIAELLRSPGKDWKNSWTPSPKQEHLACFLAGSLMLGATRVHLRPGVSRASIPPNLDEELTLTGRRDWMNGVRILDGCMDTHKTKTGLSPEGVNFRTENDKPMDREWYIRDWTRNSRNPVYDARYMLRPEISESVFLAWRLTGDQKYRDHAWNIFSAIQMYCRLKSGGYATVLDVDSVPVTHLDKQETFFLSETLKYLFMIFADENVLDLHQVVINTEAHPLPVFKPTIKPKFTHYQ
ncbi:unnamed protein product, partial [Mycena citricolor]